MTYCAICALSFLGRIPDDITSDARSHEARAIAYEDCVECIVSRQTTYLEELDEEDEVGPASLASESLTLPTAPVGYMPHLGPLSLDDEPRTLSPAPLHPMEEDLSYAGFNGRPNKVVDTCYSFWNIGALTVRALSFDTDSD